MGLFDAIGDAASSAVDAVGDGIDKAADAGRYLAKQVREAPSAIAHGASDALKGARELGGKVARAGEAALKTGAHIAAEGARLIGRGVTAAGKWAWKHKGEIGFWVGTTALMLAIPVSGGASGALAGGLMAARGAAIAAKVAQAGRVGMTAVKIARTGATAVAGARTAMAATKAGTAAAHAGSMVRAGRIALGGTKVGRAMIAAQRPVNAAGMTIGGINFADTANRYRQGSASGKDLALAGLGVAPTGVLGFKAFAARRAARANTKAAEVATRRLDDVAANASGAKDEVAHIASVAPIANAPKTAGAAADARERAVGTVNKAVELRNRAAITRSSGANADGAISATSLADELDDVAVRASSARVRAAQAEELAPADLTPVARAAKDRLERAEQVAVRAKREVRMLAARQQRAERAEEAAESVQGTLGATAMHAGLINNAVKSSREGGSTWSLTDYTVVRTITGILMGRNAKGPVGAAAAPAGAR